MALDLEISENFKNVYKQVTDATKQSGKKDAIAKFKRYRPNLEGENLIGNCWEAWLLRNFLFKKHTEAKSPDDKRQIVKAFEYADDNDNYQWELIIKKNIIHKRNGFKGGLAHKIFVGLSNALDQDLDKTFLEFLRFCNGKSLASFYYLSDDEQAKRDVQNSAPPSEEEINIHESAKLDAINELATTIKKLSKHIASKPQASDPQETLKASTERYPTVTSQDEWLNPRNELFIPFVGREDEIGLLDAFAKGDSDNELAFKLWAIVGPSGAGKTRLLTHWANRNIYNDWEAIDVNSKTDIVWSDWLPQKPTLISIDYIYGYDQVIADIIARADNVDFNFPVRLLLLDHAMPDTMAELLKNPRWNFEGSRVQDFGPMAERIFFNKAPLKLQVSKSEKVNNDLLAKIICSIVHKEETAPFEKIDDPVIQCGVKYLEDTDGAQQPLFAVLVADAIKQGKTNEKNEEEYLKFNRRALMGNYLKSRDRKTWLLKDSRELGAWAACFIAAATAIATESKGVKFRTLRKAVPKKQKTVIDQNYYRLTALCNAVVSGDGQYTLKSFRPDILGETHFLSVLKETFEGSLQDFEEALPALIVAASDNVTDGRTNEFIAFITRLARNLSNDAQSNPDAKLFWELLEEFLGSKQFVDDASFKWAASTACFEIYQILREKEQPLKQLADKFLNQVDVDVLYHPPEGIMRTRHIWVAIQYFGLNEKEGKPIPSSLIELLTLWEAEPNRDYTALMLSIWAENTTIALYLIEQDVDLNAKGLNGLTALMFACQFVLEKVALVLVEKDANLGAQNNEGVTALMEACESDLEKVALSLVEKDANLDTQDNEGWTALMLACLYKLDNVALALVEKDANLGAQSSRGPVALLSGGEGMTALMLACDSDQEKVALALVEKDANLDAQNNEGWTALMGACRYDQEKVALALVEKDANLDAQNNKGWTALILACRHNQEKVALALVEKDANLDAQNNDGSTALMLACHKGQEKVALALVEKDANLDAQNNEDWTALMLACRHNQEKVALALVEKDANLDAQNNEGWTALMLACHKGQEKVALALVEKDANLDVQNNKGSTALMGACDSDQEKVALALVKKDANLDAQDNEDWTALMLACRYDQEKLALALVEKDANLDAQNNEGWTALMFACCNDQEKVALALVERGVDINSQV